MYDSSRELAGYPECSGAIFTEAFGSEFEVGGATSEDEVRRELPGKAASRISLRVDFHHI